MAEDQNMDRELQAEIEAAMGELDLEGMLGLGADENAAIPSKPRAFNPGDACDGLIVGVTREDVFVELTNKVQGACPREQFGDDEPVTGARDKFLVVRFDKREGLIILNRAGVVQKADWEHLQEGQVIEAHCTGTNKGGLEMEVAGHRAFMPAGHASRWHVDNLEEMIGQAMVCEVIEFDVRGKNIVLSRRAVMEREAAEQKEKTLATLEVGNVVEGTVRKIMPFGAFVDIGGIDGLIHISDLSYQRVKDPSEIVQEGQPIKVQVLKIDLENNRIGLGLKQLEADPYVGAVGQINSGDTVTGRVTRVVEFGAFVEIQPGVEGLIHISELSHERVGRVDQIVQEDQVITAQVLDVDPQSRRISLSLKALQNSAETADFERPEDRGLAKLRAKFGSGGELKGGIG